jgi:hypothetical protein
VLYHFEKQGSTPSKNAEITTKRRVDSLW